MPSKKDLFNKARSTKVKLPTVGAWLTNAGKSVGMATMDVMQDLMPATFEFTGSLSDYGQTVRDYARDIKVNAAREDSAISNYLGIAKEAIKNTKNDIKSGKLYHSMEDIVDEQGGGFDGIDFGTDFDFDDSFDSRFESEDGITTVQTKSGTENGVNVSNVAVNVNVGKDSTLIKGMEKQTQVAVDMGNLQVATIEKTNARTNASISSLSSILSGVLGSIESNIGIMTESTATIAKASSVALKYYDDSMEQFKIIAEATVSIKDYLVNGHQAGPENQLKEYEDMTGLFGGSGALNLGDYIEVVKKQLNSALDSNMLTSQIKFMLSDPDQIRAMVAHPISSVVRNVVEGAFKNTIQEAASEFDNTLKEFAATALTNVAGLRNSDNPIFQFLGDTFGISNKLKTTVDKSNYRKGKVDWTGQDRKTLNEVIPFYLRKIAAAVTGSAEMGFDYEKGVFRTIESMKKEYEANDRRNLLGGLSSTTMDFRDFLEDNGRFTNSKDKEKTVEAYNKFLEKMVSQNVTVRRKQRADGKYSFRDAIEQIVGEGSLDPNQLSILAAFLDSNSNAYNLNLFGAGKQEARANMSRRKNEEEMGSLLTNGMYVNNGDNSVDSHVVKGNDGVTRVKSTFVDVDQYGRTSTSYLRDIVSLLSGGITVFPAYSMDSGNGGGRRQTRRGRHNTTTAINTNAATGSIAAKLAEDRDKYDTEVSRERQRNQGTTLSADEIAERINRGETMFDLGISDDEFEIYSAHARDRRHSEQQEQNRVSWFTRMTGIDSDKPITKVINKFTEYLQKPSQVLTDLFHKADNFLFDVVFGGEMGPGSGLIQKAGEYLKRQFTNISTWINDKILEPLHENLFGDEGIITKLKETQAAQFMKEQFGKFKNMMLGEKTLMEDGSYQYQGGAVSSLGNMFLDAGKDMKDTALTAVADTVNTVRKVTGHEKENNQTTVSESMTPSPNPSPDDEAHAKGTGSRGVPKTGSYILAKGERVIPTNDIEESKRQEQAYVDKLRKRGRYGEANLPRYAEGTPGERAKKSLDNLWGDITTRLKERASELSEMMFGSEVGKQRKAALDAIGADIKGKGSKVTANAGFGLITSFFMPWGPVGGAILGIGKGLVENSETLKNILFGELDENNERKGNIISKDIINAVDNNKTGIKLGSIAALGAGVGLLPSVFGGGLTYMASGLAISMAAKSETMQKWLYGELGEDGKRQGGGFIDKIKVAFDGKDHKKVALDAGIGAGLGIVGSLLLSTGSPFLGAVLGSAVSLTANTDKFKTFFFGDKDPDTGKRTGGVMGKLEETVLTPIKNIFFDLQDKISGWFEQKILAPIQFAIAPIGEFLYNKIQDGVDMVVNIVKATAGRLVKTITQTTKNILAPMVSPIINMTKSVFLGMAKSIGNVASMPFTVLGALGAKADKSNRGRRKRDYNNSTIVNALTFNKEKRRKLGLDENVSMGDRLKSFGDFFNTAKRRQAVDPGYSENGRSIKDSIKMAREESKAWAEYKAEMRRRGQKPVSRKEFDAGNNPQGKVYSKWRNTGVVRQAASGIVDKIDQSIKNANINSNDVTVRATRVVVNSENGGHSGNLKTAKERFGGGYEKYKANWLKKHPDGAGLLSEDDYLKSMVNKYKNRKTRNKGSMTPSPIDDPNAPRNASGSRGVPRTGTYILAKGEKVIPTNNVEESKRQEQAYVDKLRKRGIFGAGDIPRYAEGTETPDYSSDGVKLKVSDRQAKREARILNSSTAGFLNQVMAKFATKQAAMQGRVKQAGELEEAQKAGSYATRMAKEEAARKEKETKSFREKVVEGIQSLHDGTVEHINGFKNFFKNKLSKILMGALLGVPLLKNGIDVLLHTFGYGNTLGQFFENFKTRVHEIYDKTLGTTIENIKEGLALIGGKKGILPRIKGELKKITDIFDFDSDKSFARRLVGYIFPEDENGHNTIDHMTGAKLNLGRQVVRSGIKTAKETKAKRLAKLERLGLGKSKEANKLRGRITSAFNNAIDTNNSNKAIKKARQEAASLLSQEQERLAKLEQRKTKLPREIKGVDGTLAKHQSKIDQYTKELDKMKTLRNSLSDEQYASRVEQLNKLKADEVAKLNRAKNLSDVKTKAVSRVDDSISKSQARIKNYEATMNKKQSGLLGKIDDAMEKGIRYATDDAGNVITKKGLFGKQKAVKETSGYFSNKVDDMVKSQSQKRQAKWASRVDKLDDISKATRNTTIKNMGKNAGKTAKNFTASVVETAGEKIAQDASKGTIARRLGISDKVTTASNRISTKLTSSATDLVTDAGSPSAVSKLTGMMSSAVKKVSGLFDNLLTKFGGKAARAGAKSIDNVLARALKVVTKSKVFIAQAGKLITKLGKAVMGAIPFVNVAFTAYGVVAGAYDVANLFAVDKSKIDNKMRAISALWGGLRNTLPGSIIDILNELAAEILGFNIVREVSTLAYNLIASDEESESLKAAQDEMKTNYEAELNKEFQAWKDDEKNADLLMVQDKETGEMREMSFDEWKASNHNKKSFEDYNLEKNKTLGKKIGDKFIAGKNIVKDGATKVKTSVLNMKKNNTVTDAFKASSYAVDRDKIAKTISRTNADGTLMSEDEYNKAIDDAVAREKGKKILQMPIVLVKGIIGDAANAFDAVVRSAQQVIKDFGKNTKTAFSTAKSGGVFSSSYWTPPQKPKDTKHDTKASIEFDALSNIAFYINRIIMFTPAMITSVVSKAADGIGKFIAKVRDTFADISGKGGGFAEGLGNINGIKDATGAKFWTAPKDGDSPMAPAKRALFYASRVLLFVPALITGAIKDASKALNPIIEPIKETIEGATGIDFDAVMKDKAKEPNKIDKLGVNKFLYYGAKILGFIPNIMTTIGKTAKKVLGPIISKIGPIFTAIANDFATNIEAGNPLSVKYWSYSGKDDGGDNLGLGILRPVLFYTNRIIMGVPKLAFKIIGNAAKQVFNTVKGITSVGFYIGKRLIGESAGTMIKGGLKGYFSKEYWSPGVEEGDNFAGIKKVLFYITRMLTFVPGAAIATVSTVVQTIVKTVTNIKELSSYSDSLPKSAIDIVENKGANAVFSKAYWNYDGGEDSEVTGIKKIMFYSQRLLTFIPNLILGLITSGTKLVTGGVDKVKEKGKELADGIKSKIDKVKNLGGAAVDKVKSLFTGNGEDSLFGNGELTVDIPRPKLSYQLVGGNGDADIQNGFPYYSQNDPSIKNKSYKVTQGKAMVKENMGSRGCGPTALAMVASKLKGGNGNPYTPENMAALAESQGYSTNAGTTPSYFTNVGSQLGMNVTQGPATKDILNSMLGNGQPVIIQGASDKSGSPYTSSGHYVVAVGKDGNGNVVINDPRGKRYSKAYPMDKVVDGSGGAWAFSTGGNGVSGIGKFRNYFMRGGNGKSDKNWLDIVTKVKKAVAKKKVGYSQSNWITITVDGQSIKLRTDCSGFVCACLRLYGSIDNESATGQMMGWQNLDGFERMNFPGWDKLKAGDILLKNGHTEVFASNKNGKHYVYNCGGDDSCNNPNATISGHSSYTYIFRPSDAGSTSVTTSSTSTSGSSVTSLSGMMSELATAITNPITERLYGSSNSNSSSSGGASNVKLSGTGNEEKVWNFFTSNGYSKAATAGIMGNIKQESGFDPARLQNGKGPAAGLFQWEKYNDLGTRWGNLKKRADKQGVDWTDLGLQLQFAHEEIKGLNSYFDNNKVIEGMSVPSTSYNDFKKSTDVDMATYQFEKAFERAGKPRMENRLNAAQSYYNQFAGGNGDVDISRYKMGAMSDSAKRMNSRLDRAQRIDKEVSSYNDENVLSRLDNISSGIQESVTEMRGTNQGIQKFNDKDFSQKAPVIISGNGSTTNNVNVNNGTPKKARKINSEFIDADSYRVAKQIARGVSMV